MGPPQISLEEIEEAAAFIRSDPVCHETPLLLNAEYSLLPDLPTGIGSVTFKLESCQTSGSFKMRGAVNQFRKLRERFADQAADSVKIVTYSGGNYGKAFAMAASKAGFKATVIMPNHVPKDRIGLIEGFGVKVDLQKQSDLLNTVAAYVDGGYVATNPFDDLHLIAGYGSIAIELMESMAEPDVILVPVGGGGLLAGIAATLRLRGWTKCHIYGVEPETSNVMYLSFQQGKQAYLDTAKSIAVGTCAPNAGVFTYPLCKEYTQGVILVTDDDVLRATKSLYQRLQLMIEPTGAVAYSALMAGKVPIQENRPLNVLAVISGSNVTFDTFRDQIICA